MRDLADPSAVTKEGVSVLHIFRGAVCYRQWVKGAAGEDEDTLWRMYEDCVANIQKGLVVFWGEEITSNDAEIQAKGLIEGFYYALWGNYDSY